MCIRDRDIDGHIHGADDLFDAADVVVMLRIGRIAVLQKQAVSTVVGEIFRFLRRHRLFRAQGKLRKNSFFIHCLINSLL